MRVSWIVNVLPAVEVLDEGAKGCDEEGKHGEQEAHEDAVVVESNAVVDPGAVMIESLDTPVADAAVS